ncbi:MAG: hypothetical protein ACLR4A_01955 [Christensenellales bacterium]
MGAVICENRREAVDKLAQLARSAHLSLTGGREELNLRYVSQVADAQNVYEALWSGSRGREARICGG